jgi:hypothetical protein
MVVLYPNKQPLVEATFRQLVPLIPDGPEMQGLGTAIGEAAAKEVWLIENTTSPQSSSIPDRKLMGRFY